MIRKEKVPKSNVINYSVEERSVDWDDFDNVINIGNWFKLNTDRKLILSKYEEFRIYILITFFIFFTIGFILGSIIF